MPHTAPFKEVHPSNIFCNQFIVNSILLRSKCRSAIFQLNARLMIFFCLLMYKTTVIINNLQNLRRKNYYGMHLHYAYSFSLILVL